MCDNPFELYASMPGVCGATRSIKAAIKRAQHKVIEGMPAQMAYKEVRKVLDRYTHLGAGDSEPRWHAAKLFAQGCGLDPDDFYC
jgi:hypothetical protein